jgi:hypothetical protein
MTAIIDDIRDGLTQGNVLFQSGAASQAAVDEYRLVRNEQGLDPWQPCEVAAQHNVGGRQTGIESGKVVQCRVTHDVSVCSNPYARSILNLQCGLYATCGMSGHPAYERHAPPLLNINWTFRQNEAFIVEI